ncbi:formyltransferase family protein [Mesorhizobium sp.]|jgi:methionyl-tRNA formyltransferase|uniref:formyltransferase family protein n=1 Tax=Mesorhizobium sp. TaxID=1871066 RepID=UPI003568866E
MRRSENPGHATPLTAVFVLDISASTGPLLAGWLEAGHRIGAIVVPAFRRRPQGLTIGNFRRRLKRRFLLSRYIGAARVKLIEFGRPYDWEKLGRELAGGQADVLICHAFPNRIPADLLGGFAMGGLNLHPALLPAYRGPHPIHRLVVDGLHASHGGVTLHKMSAGFDEGDIVAQVTFSNADWASTEILADRIATAMRMLVSEAAPAYCRGLLPGEPQPAGDFAWARLESRHLMIAATMSIDHVARLWRVMGMMPGIYIASGGSKVRLGLRIARLGPPTGEPPVKRWGTVVFDLADGRVLHLTYTRLVKRLVHLKRLVARVPPRTSPLEIRTFGKVPPDGGHTLP